MALGSAIGGAIGTGAGAFIGGPIGAQIGGGIGQAIGGAFDASGQKIPDVERVDPNQAARLKEIQDTRKQISAGTDPLTQARISEIRKVGETTKGQLGKFTGGDVGSTVTALLRAQRNIGAGQNQAFTQSQQRLPFFENLESQLGNRIAQRKLELDINAQDTARARQAATQQQIIGGISGAIGAGAGGGGVDSLGQFSSALSLPAISTLGLETTFQQGLSGQSGVGGSGQQLGSGVF